jgi:hypothetical protein
MIKPEPDNQKEPRNVQDEIKAISDTEMHWGLDQVQHMLNALINGDTLDGSGLDQSKLVAYKLAVITAKNICSGKSP